MNEHSTAKLQKVSTPVHGGVLQRKCACGNHTMGGECEQCGKKLWTLHRKAMGQNDLAEVPPIVHEVLRSPGQPLDAATRAFMEPRFGHDFSGVGIHSSIAPHIPARFAMGTPQVQFEHEADKVANQVTRMPAPRTGNRTDFGSVRIHTDARAAESARMVNAQAFTVGNHIVLDARKYSPHTFSGQILLAHELAHVVQQRAARDLNLIQRSPKEPENQHPLPHREAMENTEHGLYEEYVRECSGVRVLSRLQKEPPISPFERATRLEDRLKFIPMYFHFIRSVSSGQPSANDLVNKAVYQCVKECIFGKDYALLSQETELAITKCQLSEARWQSVALTHHGRIPGQPRNLSPDKVPWVPNPKVCFNPARMEELKKNILSGHGCGGEVQKKEGLIL
jgi:hypothetical protein